MMKRYALVLVLALTVDIAAASDKTQLSESEARRMADTAARKNQVALTHYEQPKVSYDRGEHTWSVYYAKKKKFQQGDFDESLTIYVDDKTKEVWLIPGR